MPINSTNLKNRVNKLHLPRTKPLLPLFEVISNSIHAIEEKRKKYNLSLTGKIRIKIIRNGADDILQTYPDIDKVPINSFEVTDNGIGLDTDNYNSFQEFDSEYKEKIGGKGIGRLVCLKAFQKLIYDSVFKEGTDKFHFRKFEYKRSKEGFENYDEGEFKSDKPNSGTKVTLYKIEDEFLRNLPITASEIAREISTHFQLYYLEKKQPEITILNQDNTEINLTNLFNSEQAGEILRKDFNLNDQSFTVYISKSNKAKSHKIHYCAHERTVKDEGLSKYLNDFKYIAKESPETEGYYFQVYVVGDFLNKNVNDERTGFKFATDEDSEELDFEEITLAKIRRNALNIVEQLLTTYLQKVRQEKLNVYIPIVQSDYPNYNSVINYNREKVEKLPAGLSSAELDLKLYEIESEWKLKVKMEGLTVLDKKKDITSLEDYKSLYDNFLTEFNQVGQSDLARYVVHRRAVIDLLDKLIELNIEDKFTDEDIIHSLFFPIREAGESVTSDKQNLWLLDERLTFNSLLASDKVFKKIPGLGSDSKERMDLLVKKEDVYEHATLFSENRTPFESFTIVEFKKPGRNDYVYHDEKKDPVTQVRKYIREIVDGKVKRNGRVIDAKANTPFYCYIVADVTDSLKLILEEEQFDPTPDGKGFFRFYDTTKSKAYIEVLPFEKVIADARQRNRVLFEKLNISTVRATLQTSQ